MLKCSTLLLASAALLSSCSSSTPSGPDPASEFVHAHAVSTFTFDEYFTDSMNMAVAGSRDTLVSTVLKTNGAMAGRTGVLFVQDMQGMAMDTSYNAYEANDNASMLVHSEFAPSDRWATLPVATGTTTVSVATDSTVDQGVTSITRDCGFKPCSQPRGKSANERRKTHRLSLLFASCS